MKMKANYVLVARLFDGEYYVRLDDVLEGREEPKPLLPPGTSDEWIAWFKYAWNELAKEVDK